MPDPDALVREMLGPSPTGSLAELLDDVERFVRRFVSFASDGQAVAVALWTSHVYAIAAAPRQRICE
jgi:hypothetical protein